MIDQLLRFKPILKQKIWGGEKLKTVLNKKTEESSIGESWEISDVRGDESVVSNGEFVGTTLKELLKSYKSSLVGESVYNDFKDDFPLLIKYIDAKEVLSVQLHPNDNMAKQRHDSFGKTEMWYVMQADEKSNIIVGFQKDSNKEEYLHHLKNKSLLEILNIDEVSKGDVYFIPPGRVHAIGGGVLIAEIQQTSDITYRIFDWDRKDKDGSYRELHTDKALEVINYKSQASYKTNYEKKHNEATKVVSCVYFTTNVLPVKGELSINHYEKDSFVIYMCVAGNVTFTYKNQIEKLTMGETIMVPACLKDFVVTSSEKSELLEVFMPKH